MSRKVICVGSPKTGTTSLSFALLLLGYKVSLAGFSRMPKELSYNSILDFALSDSENFDAIQDTPWYCFYKELDKKYPGSKFILTIRNAEKWYSSWENSFKENTIFNDITNFLFFEGRHEELNKEKYISQFEKRNNEILKYFKERPDDLLILDLEKKIGWNDLCKFLNKKEPAIPYPNIRPQDFKIKEVFKLIRNLKFCSLDVIESIDLGKEWIKAVPNKTYRYVFYIKNILLFCNKSRTFIINVFKFRRVRN